MDIISAADGHVIKNTLNPLPAKQPHRREYFRSRDGEKFWCLQEITWPATAEVAGSREVRDSPTSEINGWGFTDME